MVKIAMKNKNGALKQNFLNFAKMLRQKVTEILRKMCRNLARHVHHVSPTRIQTHEIIKGETLAKCALFAESKNLQNLQTFENF